MEIYKKLLEAKKEIGKISKDSTNPFFKSKYFDINAILDHVEPILQKNSLLLLQPIQDQLVKTVIYHSESGEYVSSEIALPQLNDPQKLGSAITYYRRYTLQSLLGLQAEDDDANKASRINTERLSVRLNACTELSQLEAVYKSFTTPEKAAMAKIATELKNKLTPKAA